MNLNLLPGLLPIGGGQTRVGSPPLLAETEPLAAFAQLLGERFLPDTPQAEPSLAAGTSEASTLPHASLNPLPILFNEPALPKRQDISHHDEQTPPLAETPGAALLPPDPLLQSLVALLPAPPLALPDATEKPADNTTTSLPATAQSQAEALTAPVLPSKAPAAVTEKPSLPMKNQPFAPIVPQPEGIAEYATTPLKSAAEPALPPAPINPTASAPIANPAATPFNAAISPSPTPQLAAPLGSPEWQQALSQQVFMFHHNGQQRAELRLHPQELGTLQITLKLDDNQAQLHITSAHHQVRMAVEAALPYLRTALEENGINLGQSSVGAESQSQQPRQQAAHHDTQPACHEQHVDVQQPIEPIPVPVTLQKMGHSASGIDIFA
ncbi:hypothetical protein Z042_22375 [Chania multitudinisentens RB-25]|uniref:Flagellar hook-length control protein-like C-terminal domain-containing protein n=1 Tax=Chania multitudinisentens RB-25 TaxID=1441930 RepID=W0LEA8_9GAMM|nr:flagellar hook-length control protein FliK [Chania multitudinisentens]AHG22061.1 hypothetical protein Z042_22375 [Chania multitudinisentens RB-25]